MPLAKAFISFDVLIGLMRKGGLVHFSALLPGDAQMRTVSVDVARGGLFIVLEAASFPVSAEGDLLPDVTLGVTSIAYKEDVDSLNLPSRVVVMEPAEKVTGLP